MAALVHHVQMSQHTVNHKVCVRFWRPSNLANGGRGRHIGPPRYGKGRIHGTHEPSGSLTMPWSWTASRRRAPYDVARQMIAPMPCGYQGATVLVLDRRRRGMKR